ncbi:S9 family peptidase [Snuella lapsa]|uniref:S9 family peptidase n=1 Tax=Snuella lapsa TaxID=870481 RepID=A0ABP6XR33_9FLAO
MKYNAIGLLIALIVVPCFGQKELSSDAYKEATRFLGHNTYKLVDNAYVSPNWLEDGRFWYRVTENNETNYVMVDPKKKSKKSAETLRELLASNTINEVNRKTARNEVVSPDGTKSVFIKDWNLWMRHINTDEEIQLTTDGIENFGYATDNAGWRKSDKPIVLWSPDSKKIATFQQDQRHVSDMYLVKTTVGEPELESWKYPLPSDEKIIQIHRVIINVDEPKIIRLNIPSDPRRGTLCDDISCSGSFDDNDWSSDSSTLAFVSTSRDHKVEKFRIANAQTGEVREVFSEIVDTQYESGQGTINWHYLPSSNEIIWYSERDNWGHLYLYDATTGALKHQITKGDFVVTQLLRVDEEQRKLYFLAQGKEAGQDPYFAYFYSVDFSGKNLELLTPENGNHNISLAPNGSYFVDNFSQPNVPNVAVLRSNKGKLIKTLETQDISRLEAMGWKPPKPIKVKSRDGRWDCYGLMFTPTYLDTQKQYPVVNYIYPGPQGGGVGKRNFYPSRGDHQALAELGFIVVVIDGTNNPGRSKAFHDANYGSLSDNTLLDQIVGIKQLAQKYPYMDLERVGIWGHSGGGNATTTALLLYPDFYKVGVSQSGNHDNRNYEDDWGERYIGLMKGDNYKEQANQYYVDNLKGKLLIAHGNMDDNVPPYNTYLVVEALIKANKDFDLLIFPNQRHGYGADTYYMTRRRWDYFVKHLMGAIPPKEFKIVR